MSRIDLSPPHTGLAYQTGIKRAFEGGSIVPLGPEVDGGGALVTDDADWAARARWLPTQARDPAPHYQHTWIGYNYRLSNLLAALGRSQLSDLKGRVDIRRAHNAFYREALADSARGRHQSVFSDCEVFGGGVSEHLFPNGLCIPSGFSRTDSQRDQVVGAIRAVFGRS